MKEISIYQINSKGEEVNILDECYGKIDLFGQYKSTEHCGMALYEKSLRREQRLAKHPYREAHVEDRQVRSARTHLNHILDMVKSF